MKHANPRARSRSQRTSKSIRAAEVTAFSFAVLWAAGAPLPWLFDRAMVWLFLAPMITAVVVFEAAQAVSPW